MNSDLSELCFKISSSVVLARNENHKLSIDSSVDNRVRLLYRYDREDRGFYTTLQYFKENTMTEGPKFYNEIKNRVKKATIINQAGLNKILDVYEEYGEDKVTRHLILTMVYYAVQQEVYRAFKKRGHVPFN